MDILLVAQGFGALGFILGMIAFWQLDDKKLLLLSAAYNTAFLIQYLLLGAYSTSLMVVVLASSIYVSAYTKKTRWMLLFIALAFAQWLALGGVDELVGLVATVLGIYSYYKMQGVALRVTVFIAALMWLFVAFYFDAWFSFAFNIFTMAMTALAGYRLKQKQFALLD